MATALKLPEGFVLDEEETPKAQLPEGFVLDAEEPLIEQPVTEEIIPEAIPPTEQPITEEITPEPIQPIEQPEIVEPEPLRPPTITHPAGRALEEVRGLAEAVPSAAIGMGAWLASFPVGVGEALGQIVGKDLINLKEGFGPEDILIQLAKKLDFKAIQNVRHEFQEDVGKATEFLTPKTVTGQKYLEGIAYPFQKYGEVVDLAGEWWADKAGGTPEEKENVRAFVSLFGDVALLAIPKMIGKVKAGEFKRVLPKELPEFTPDTVREGFTGAPKAMLETRIEEGLNRGLSEDMATSQAIGALEQTSAGKMQLQTAKEGYKKELKAVRENVQKKLEKEAIEFEERQAKAIEKAEVEKVKAVEKEKPLEALKERIEKRVEAEKRPKFELIEKEMGFIPEEIRELSPVRFEAVYQKAKEHKKFREVQEPKPEVTEPKVEGVEIGKVYTKQEMIDVGAGGSLSKAKAMEIPIKDISGFEPIPEPKSYKKGRKVTQPIEVIYDKNTGEYTLFAGNHRVQQAKINKQKTIPAFVENYKDITPKAEVEVIPKPEVKKPVEAELKTRVDEAIGEVTAPVGMSIKTVSGRTIREAREFKFESPEAETRWKASQGVRKPLLRDRGREALKTLWHKMSRGVFEHLPRTKEFSQLRTDLLKLARQKGVATDKALRNIQGITINFKTPDRNLFDRKVILEDLKATAEKGKEVPFGFTKENVAKELNRVDAGIAKHPEIKKAVELRRKVWDALREDYTSAMKDIGFDVSGRLKNENYFRHQVLDYVQAKGLFGTGRKLKVPVSRGFLKKRKGSELDINVDYIQAEHEVMSQMFYDIEVAKTIKRIDKSYNIIDKVRADAKKEGLKDWHEAIPEGYTTWQPREGNVFYMTDTIPAKLAEQLTEGKLEEIGVTRQDLGRALSMGSKRKEFVVKEEIANTLNDLVRNRDRGRVMEIDRKLLRAWKVWQLISPRRFAKYNFRNLTGDADGAFLGNPSGFKKMSQAYKELYETFYGDKSMTPTMKDWFERGGMETTLQAQEMGQINKLRMFQRQYETKNKVSEVPAKIWQGYWKNVRLTTDFREAILRYANYLDYLEQMKADPKGLPKNYGASMREEIQGLTDMKSKAFKLSNELLGAYDDISVIGQALREHVFPFWSWKEINMKRYYRVYRNALQDGKMSETAGRHALKGIATTPYKAYRVGKFLAMATAFWSTLQVWNNLMFPEEESELSEQQRTRPHIIFGRDDEGKIISFDRIGALGDFLEWFGLDAAPLYLSRWIKGKMTLPEIGKEMAKSPVNVVVQGLTPYFKTPMELLSKRAFFPDFSRPRTIRNSGLHIAGSLGLADEYKALTGLPSKPYTDSLSKFFFYKTDPKQAAYGDIYEEKRRFLKKLGKGGEGFWLSPRGDALYNMKLAIRYKDKKAAQDYFLEYLSYAGSIDSAMKGIEKSLENMNPLSGLNKEEQLAFVLQLDAEGKEKLIKALIFYDEVLLGKGEEK